MNSFQPGDLVEIDWDSEKRETPFQKAPLPMSSREVFDVLTRQFGVGPWKVDRIKEFRGIPNSRALAFRKRGGRELRFRPEHFKHHRSESIEEKNRRFLRRKS